MQKTPYLFVIDLDGTLLDNSALSTISPANVAAIRRAVAQEHVVCIATGRPWRSTQAVYEKLGLTTIVANYNGAHIHNPSDYDFTPHISYLNMNDVMYVIGDPEIQKVKKNIAIEGPGWVTVEHFDPVLERVFGFDKAKRYREGIDYHKLPLRPTGVIFDTKPGVNVALLQDYLKRTYGDIAEFSSWSKGDNETPVFDMTKVGVTKGKVLPLLSRYYGIPISRSVAIGDGYNDVPMFEVAEFSVATANASEDIKSLVTYVCQNTHRQDAVAEFINQFLDDLAKDQTFIRKLSAKRREKLHLKDQTNLLIA